MTYARPGRDARDITPRSAPPARRKRGFARLVGAVGLIVLTALLYWMLTDDAFRVTDASVSFEGLAHAQEAEVRARLSDIDRGPNVFRVRATDIVSELSTLPEVDAAHARVTLPAEVSVRLDERDPVFIWSNGAVAWLVDEEGMLFAPADQATAETEEATEQVEPDADPDANPDADPDADPDAAAAEDAGAEAEAVSDPTVAARESLPLVEDGRLPPVAPTVGDFLPQSDLAVMRQLLALTPELLGSKAQDLHLRVDKQDGYVLESHDRTWRALFGRYTPSLQPPEVIPQQVQCLQWLLASEERRLEQVRLALSDEACGTFTKFDAG
jgi:hypothetical protein